MTERTFPAAGLTLVLSDKRVWLRTSELELETGLGSLHELFDQPDLATLGTTHVIASPPTAYVLVGRGTLGLEDVTAGDYTLRWLDLDAGSTSEPIDRTLDGADEAFDAPTDGAVVLVLRRVGR